MKASEALSAIRKDLRTGKPGESGDRKDTSTYICHCLLQRFEPRWPLEDKGPEVAASQRARKLIQDQLGHHFNLESWLKQEVKVPPKDLTYENLQRHRHQWLHRLIAELQRKGD